MAVASTTPNAISTADCLARARELAPALTEFSLICHQLSVNAGWYQDPKTGEMIQRNVPEMLALIHSEVSEALEGVRKNKVDDHLPHRLSAEVEAGDAVIRLGDLTGCLGFDIGAAIYEKLVYNASRSDHTLAARAADGGKAF